MWLRVASENEWVFLVFLPTRIGFNEFSNLLARCMSTACDVVISRAALPCLDHVSGTLKHPLKHQLPMWTELA